MREKCFYCGVQAAVLGDGRIKCSGCGRRYSPVKIRRRFRLAEAFCHNRSARAASAECATSLVSAQQAYRDFRRLIIPLLESDYEAHREAVTEYDEYLYLDANKRRDRRHIFDAHNFLTFQYGEKVYTLMMPSLERYKESFLSDGLEEVYYREFSRYLSFHRVARLRSRQNTIVRFWRFFEELMPRYKGVRRENFVDYLKEAEFKFNYPMPERIEILRTLILEETA